MPLRVGIDVAPLALTRAGTARYITNLIAALEDERALELRRYTFGGPGRATRVVRDIAWYLARLPEAARRDSLDVLHCPSARGPFRSRVPFVVTIHDLAVLRHPAAFNRWTRAYSKFALPRVARAASAIITGSGFTSEELGELLNVPAPKVRVIPYGVGPPFTATGPRAEGDYVLTVSTLEPRKNLTRLIEGFRRADLDECELRVVGARGWGGVSVGGARVRWVPDVDDHELARLYRGARCVAYVSLYEGFGLPVLEAMACGAPVVTSAGAPFREFAEGVAVTVDPYDPDAIAEGLEQASRQREALAMVGPPRASEFDWGRTARQTLEVYREVAG